MFAPPAAKPKWKAAEPQRSTLVAQRPGYGAVNQAVMLQRSIGNQAMLRLHAQQAPASGILQRHCACGTHTNAGGECEACGKKKRLGLQTKLEVNEPGDRYEQEADRIANQVMASPTTALVRATPAPIQRHSGPSSGGMDAAPTSVHQALASPGAPLEPVLQQDMEQRFGYDFSRVRVHSDSAAERSAKDVNAHAYAVGHTVVFGTGRFAPGTHEGRRLVAHELTHVVQQTGHVSLQRDDKGADENFIIDPKAMDLVESALNQLYEALPRSERIELKANGTVAVGMVTKRGALSKPRLVYTTAGNRASPAFREAAERVGLFQWEGDAGVVGKREGPSRNYPATESLPPGMGGIEHAEQFMVGFAEHYDYIIHGMAVSRRLCNDCPLVIRGHKGGRVMISVIPDPDSTLPNPRAERLETKQLVKDTNPSSHEGGGGQREKPNQGGGTSRNRKPPTPTRLGGRGATKSDAPRGGSLRGGKSPNVPNQRRGGGSESIKAPAPAVSSKVADVVVPSGARVTEGRGESVTSISVPEPALAINATKGAIEGVAALIVSMQLSALRSAELRKATDRLAELQREIDGHLEKGFSVAVTLVVEVPDQVDIAAIWAGIGDPGQVVKFKKMYISQVIAPSRAGAISTHAVMRANLAPGDPDQQDPHEFTLQQQIKGQMGEKHPVPGTGPQKGFHFGSNELFLAAPTRAGKQSGQASEDLTRLRDIAGTYRPKFEALFIGHLSIVVPMGIRKLQVELDAGGKPLPKMSVPSQSYSYQPYVLDGPRVMGGLFTLGKGVPPESQWILSFMTYHPQEGLILEWAKGLDADRNVVWDALFSWQKIGSSSI